jgi:phosphatidylethanolamine/phosphatidyl-N-methylethanolamine N-methyltransferase
MKSPRGTESGPSFTHVVRAYHRVAPFYDRIFGAVYEHGRRELARTASQIIKGHSLLEIGVGTGLTLPLYPKDFAITGVDICPDMLARAQRRAERELPGREIRLQLMDGEKLDFADGSFDCVVLAYVLSVTPHPARLVAEARRVCRKDGIIFVLNHFNGSRVWWLLERMVRPLANVIGFRSDFSLDEHVMRHDWKVQAIQVVNLFGLSKLVTIRNA